VLVPAEVWRRNPDARFSQSLLRAGWIYESANGGDAVAGKAYPPGVFLDARFVLGKIDAVDHVAGYVAVQPLDLGTHFVQNADRPLRDGPQLGIGEASGSRNFAFNDEFWHANPECEPMLTCCWSGFKTSEAVATSQQC
jgi:hypothetical protein